MTFCYARLFKDDVISSIVASERSYKFDLHIIDKEQRCVLC